MQTRNDRGTGFVAALAVACLSACGAALAQLSSTTFGNSEAALCYRSALNEASRDVSSCDLALARGDLTIGDENKTLVNRAIIYNRRGDYEAAFADLNRAIDRAPDLAEAFVNRGNAYFMTGNFKNALSDYETALLKDIKDKAAAWYNIGLTYERLNRPLDAREAFNRALEHNPEFAPARAKLEPVEAD